MLLGGLLKGICGTFEDKVSFARSIITTKTVTPRSSDESKGLWEILEEIALIGQGTMSSKLSLVLSLAQDIYISCAILPNMAIVRVGATITVFMTVMALLTMV